MSTPLFKQALERFDAFNREDPNRTEVDGESHPTEWLYAERLTTWVQRLENNPSPELLLAARAAHIGRWQSLRKDYPEGLNGYLQWREELKQHHAHIAATLLTELGFDEPTIKRVVVLVKKETFPEDPESRALEDALCLMFMEFQFDEVAAKTGHQKMVGILQKTWDKMSPAGKAAALALDYSPGARALIEEAGCTLTDE